MFGACEVLFTVKKFLRLIKFVNLTYIETVTAMSTRFLSGTSTCVLVLATGTDSTSRIACY